MLRLPLRHMLHGVSSKYIVTTPVRPNAISEIMIIAWFVILG
jgi:hypothetical protein